MKFKSKAYIVLQEDLSSEEENALGQAVVDALPPVAPPRAFVTELGRNLVAEARRRQETEQQRHHVARTVGLVGGGVLSVVGGFAIWFFMHRHQKDNGAKIGDGVKISTPPPTPAAVAHAGRA